MFGVLKEGRKVVGEGSAHSQAGVPVKRTLRKKLLLFVCLCLGFCVLHRQRVLYSANELINGWKG